MPIDEAAMCRYSVSIPLATIPLNRAGRKKAGRMSVKTILLGQVWRSNANGQSYLVTKVYSELFSQYAMLRPVDADAAKAETMRVKVSKAPEGSTLPGFTYTQESQDF